MPLDIQPLDVQPLDIQPLDIQPLEEEQVSKRPGDKAAYEKYAKAFDEEQKTFGNIPGRQPQKKLSEKEWQDWQDSKLKDSLLAIPQTALSIASLPLSYLNAVGGALANSIARGVPMEPEYHRIMEQSSYTPSTDKGQKYTEKIGEWLQPFGLSPYVANAASFRGRGPKPKLPSIEERLAQVDAAKKAETPVAPLDIKPLEFTKESPLAIDESLPYQYKGGIDAPELATKQDIRTTFDPTAEKRVLEQEVKNLQNELDRTKARSEIYKQPDGTPDTYLEKLRPDLEKSAEAFDALQAEQARVKRLEEQAAWTQREESIPERRMAEERAVRMEESLQQLQEDLSQERVSKGQQRKANKQKGALDVSFMDRLLQKELAQEEADSRSMRDATNSWRIRQAAEDMHGLTKEFNDSLPLIQKASKLYNDLAVGLIGSNGDFGSTIKHMENFQDNMFKAAEALQKNDTDAFERHTQNAKYHWQEAGDFKKTLNEYLQSVQDERFDLRRRRSPAAKEMLAAIDGILGPNNVIKLSSNKQRGAIDFKAFGETYQSKLDKVNEIMGSKMFAPKPSPESVVAAALSEGKDGKGLNLMESGSSLAAAKRDSALIQGVSRIMQHEVNKADLDIRTHVFPAEKSLRSLSRKELEPLMKVFLAEAKNELKYSAEELAGLGLSVKQLAAYSDVRKMFKETLAKENEARIAQGKKPVTEAEYYSSSRWQGDFRQDFHDASGKHVWSLAGTSTRDLRKQREALLKEFPELVPSKERIINTAKGEVNPLEMYKTMLEILGDEDPAVARIKEWYQQSVADEAASTLAQEKHFKTKSGVRGFVGDRPGKSGVSEALAFFQQQITYAKNGMKWSAMQRAAGDIKNILSNEDLVAQQPNNVAYAREYLKHNLGFGEAQVFAGLENSLRQIGISPNEVRGVLGNVKAAWITQKLVASPGFVLSNLVQSTAILPHMMDAMVKYGGNPLTGLIGGMAGMLHLGAGHFMSMAGKGAAPFRKATHIVMPDFLNKALKYAEDNGVTSRSTYDESPIQSSFNPVARGVDLASKLTITTPETMLRAFTFSTFASQLKESKAFKTELEVFRKAEELTNIALGDYRQGERPMVFSKLGMTGDIMGTLSTFPMNYYNQWNWATREAFRGNVVPALTMFVVQGYIAGAMGLPGFQDIDKAFDMVKAWAAENSPKLWKQIKDWSPKQMVMDYLGEDALYGNASTKTNLALTSRVAAPSVTDMVGMPGGMAADLGKQAVNIGSAIVNPSKEAAAKATIESAPVGLQGYLETGPLRDTTSRQRGDERLYLKRGKPTPEGDFARTPEDEKWRAWGLRTQRETLTRDETYRLQQSEQQTKQAVNASFDGFYNAARKGDIDQAKSYARLYTELSGKGITNQQINAQIIKEWTTSKEKALTAAKQVEAMKAAKRMMDILEEAQ